jgi:two-component system response regulator HydG
MSTAPCETPFARADGLCRTCRAHPEGAGGAGKRCSRMVVRSPQMQALLARAATVAATDASVVLKGESGAGKEVVARALHANSPRAARPFVAVNCAALPAELLESELFGHARGAFTGATERRRGLFETAHGGTLFLDEVAEMPLPLQAKLLRVLQDGEVRRVGESEPFAVDVRVVCASHEDLQQEVAARRFREDLYFRLKVFTLLVPPLRERREDIPVLAHLFLQQERHRTGRFTPAAMDALERHRWPGNVRELLNAVKHGAALSLGADVDTGHLPEDVVTPPAPARAPALPPATAPAAPSAPPALLTLAEAERLHVLRVLEACGGHQQEAARALGIGRTTLWRKLRAYGLAPRD